MSTIDNSTGCGHSGYGTTDTIYTPDGRSFSGGGGLTGQTSGPTDDVIGDYTDEGQLSFQCSCVGTVGYGGGIKACLALAEPPHPDGSQQTSGSPASWHSKTHLAGCTSPAANSPSRVDANHKGTPTVYTVSSILRLSLPAGSRKGLKSATDGAARPISPTTIRSTSVSQ